MCDDSGTRIQKVMLRWPPLRLSWGFPGKYCVLDRSWRWPLREMATVGINALKITDDGAQHGPLLRARDARRRPWRWYWCSADEIPCVRLLQVKIDFAFFRVANSVSQKMQGIIDREWTSTNHEWAMNRMKAFISNIFHQTSSNCMLVQDCAEIHVHAQPEVLRNWHHS